MGKVKVKIAADSHFQNLKKRTCAAGQPGPTAQLWGNSKAIRSFSLAAWRCVNLSGRIRAHSGTKKNKAGERNKSSLFLSLCSIGLKALKKRAQHNKKQSPPERMRAVVGVGGC